MQKLFHILFFVVFALTGCELNRKNLETEKSNTTLQTKISVDLEHTSLKFNPKLSSTWGVDEHPGVIVCDDFIRVEEVKKAIRFWAVKGYKFRSVRKSINFHECSSKDPIPGHIRIRLFRSDDRLDMNGKIAITIVEKYAMSNLIIGVDIVGHSFMPDKALTLEHEIGHALGWNHVNVESHIMHPEWIRLGRNMSGLSYDEYRAASEKMLFDS